MGLTHSSTGRGTAAGRREAGEGTLIALAGNPNVGKSTLFNALTGLRQHTGNWSGKTISSAQGRCRSSRRDYILADLPGTYSLLVRSAEEEVTRDFLCRGGAKAAVVVCDAACLERNLNLALQVMECCDRVLLCVNLMDEAQRKGIHVDLEGLSRRLGIPVVGTVARRRKSLSRFLDALDELVEGPPPEPLRVRYSESVERALELLTPPLEAALEGRFPARWFALRLLEKDEGALALVHDALGRDVTGVPAVAEALELAGIVLGAYDLRGEGLTDAITAGLIRTAQAVSRETVQGRETGYSERDRRADRVLTGKTAAYPAMLLLLLLVFYLTISGANVLSDWLGAALFRAQDLLTGLFRRMNAPAWLHGALVLGAYRVLAWVVSVMLPPMAIFFPLFTLLEDIGYLPRIAYNLDRPFQRCSACGKQALTMSMGLGCNAAGVVGCRIIDSPRERLLATLTNSLVPCNGRFPALLTVLTMFFAGGALAGFSAALLLTGAIVLGVAATFFATWLLSRTLLRGLPSSFVLEMPPYRWPQVGQVIVRSVLDRTVFVLARAAAVAAPAGLLIWALANIQAGGVSLLAHCAAFLDPFGRLLGMDGAILLAFVLGLPANEIVLPLILMIYTAQGSLQDLGGLAEMKAVLTANGWTWTTALCVALFILMHWPCSTTLLTVKKETGSWKWTALAMLLPAVLGMAACFLVALAARIFG